jgi:hypothetical protein
MTSYVIKLVGLVRKRYVTAHISSPARQMKGAGTISMLLIKTLFS